MKRTLLVLFFTTVVLSGVWATTPGADPEAPDAEYYYTRIMYTGVGTPERDPEEDEEPA